MGNGLVQRCIVLYSAPVNFKSGDGKEVKGLRVVYLPTDTLEPLEISNDFMTEYGYKPAEEWLPYNLAAKVTVAPAIYEITFVSGVGKDRKMKLVPNDLKLVAEFSAA